MIPFKIEAIIRSNGAYDKGRMMYVINRKPVYHYKYVEGSKSVIYAKDGPFVRVYCHRPKSRDAFGGRKFDIQMADGSKIYAIGDWWDGGHDKVAEELKARIVHAAYGTIEDLKDCYVFFGGNALEKELQPLIDEYMEEVGFVYDYWDYKKVICFDDLQKKHWQTKSRLEKDKRILVDKVKSMAAELKALKNE